MSATMFKRRGISYDSSRVHEHHGRRLNIVADIDWVQDETIRAAALELGFCSVVFRKSESLAQSW